MNFMYSFPWAVELLPSALTYGPTGSSRLDAGNGPVRGVPGSLRVHAASLSRYWGRGYFLMLFAHSLPYGAAGHFTEASVRSTSFADRLVAFMTLLPIL